MMIVEKTLLDFGKSTYEKVIDMINKEYHCGLTACYEHPEYLSAVLKKLFGNAHIVIVISIKKQLEEFLNKEPIKRFVEVISR